VAGWTDCGHRDCDGDLVDDGRDPWLPRWITRLKCTECGEQYLADSQDGTVEIDA